MDQRLSVEVGLIVAGEQLALQLMVINEVRVCRGCLFCLLWLNCGG